MSGKEKWFLWVDGKRDPYLNMAVDELLLERSASFGRPVLRIYGWDRPSVSIGYVQNFGAAPAEGYAVVRRPTGGGVVFHDVDLTYTVVVPEGNFITGLNRVESYHVLHRAVLRMFKAFGRTGALAELDQPVPDRATMQCFTTPTRYDVLIDGRKHAGSAQRRTKNGILHQGSISLLAGAGDEGLLVERLVAAFEQELALEFERFEPDAAFMEAARNLAAGKYATDEWNKSK